MNVRYRANDRDLADSPGLMDLLAHWPVEALEVKRFQDVYRIRTAEADYVFKPLNKSRRRARYIAALQEYLAGQGTGLTPALLRTASGDLIASQNRRRHWIVCEWIGGRVCDWDDIDDARNCAASLGEFHRLARGCGAGPGQSPRAYWYRWPRKLEARSEALEWYCGEARRRLRCGDGAEFDELVVSHAPRLLAWADEAKRVLVASRYEDLCGRYQRLNQVVHGDPAGRNFVATELGRIKLIDLETVRLDLPALDIAKMLRRALKKHRWRVSLADDLLRAYNLRSPVEAEMLPIVWTFLAFPTKLFRDLRRYYDTRPGWSYRRHLHKLRKHLRQSDRQDELLERAYERLVEGV